MTEGPLQNEKPMCVRVWLEVGHACEPRQSALGRALALDWRVWVRGASGQDISAFVHKVVFYLHPASAFVYPKRVIQEPPYEIQESGSASIEIPIHVYLKHCSRPRRIRLRYSLRVDNAARRSRDSRSVYYDVENPSEPLWRALVRGGGEVVARTDSRAAAADRLLVLLPDAKPPAPRRMKPRRALPPAPDPKPALKKCKEEPCVAGAGPGGKCGAAVGTALRRQLVAAALTTDEAARVWRLCAAVARYERSPDALPLPPLGDPIYCLPEPPPSLRAALSSVESDLAMQ